MNWNIDSAHSVATFKIRHLGISNVRGSFSNLSGNIETDDAGRIVSVKASIPVDTVNTNQADRDGHLKQGDFFDVAQYPTMEFVSTSVSGSGSDYTIEGNLTMRGVTKPITLTAEVNAPVADPNSGKQKIGGEANVDINRKDFGITTGGPMLGDKVSITLEIQAAEA